MSYIENMIKVRDMLPDDRPFILSSALKSLRHTSDMKNIPNKEFFPILHNKFDAILKSKKVIVICNPQYPEQIYSYLIYDGKAIYYIYVKHIYRRFGHAKFMLKKAFGDRELYELDYPFKTFASEKMAQKGYLKLRHNPLLI